MLHKRDTLDEVIVLEILILVDTLNTSVAKICPRRAKDHFIEEGGGESMRWNIGITGIN